MPPSIYRRALLETAPRLLGMLDREPDSRTAGSFDREHWAWKFRDHPVNMLHWAMLPLAALWDRPWPDNPYHRNPRLLGWLARALETLIARQHRNGAFDTVGPFTQDHGVTLAMAYGITSAIETLGAALPDGLAGRCTESVRRACDFAATSSEDYAFISNHQALFALAWLRAHRLLGDATLLERAEQTVREVIAQQSRDGWYREYGGPDPGYESLGIHYLAQYWRLRPSEVLLDSLERAVDFYRHCVHPDGSVGGDYGSRHTSLYVPGGFELLAHRLPHAGSVARFMRDRLARGNVATPWTVDDHNLAPLLQGYLTAADVRDARSTTMGVPPEPNAESLTLPCETLHGVRVFDDSALTVAGTQHYFAVANLSKGGVTRIFSRTTGRLAYQDAGYLLESGGFTWGSQSLGLARSRGKDKEEGVQTEATFAQVRQEELTPSKFLLLRILNLTVFRSVRLGALVRRMIIAQLVTGRTSGDFKLERRLRFASDRVVFEDVLRSVSKAPVERVRLARRFMPIHMGSAKYFHGNDLEDTPLPDLDGVAGELTASRASSRRFEIVFDAAGAVTLVASAGARSAAHNEDTATR